MKKEELEEVIRQLNDLICDRESFIEENDPDCPFKRDIWAIETIIKEYQRLKELENKILTEITTFCETCGSKENCPEEECVLFRIEQIVLNASKGSETHSEGV